MSYPFGQSQTQSQQFGVQPANTGFGGFSGFGQQQQTSQPSFGGSAFGAPATATSTAPPAFGTSGGFGAQTTSTGFGGFSGFGQSGSQPGFGGSTFGAPATSTAAPAFGTGGGFGTQTTSTGFGGFGGFGSSTSQPTFGGSTFGTTGVASNTSGTTFGAGGGFGGGTSTFGTQQTGTGFGGFSSFLNPQQQQQQALQQQQQQQQQIAIDEQAAFHQSIFGCCKFGDERDSILANLNYVQACWGAGKGFYNQANPPVTYNDKNVIYRFKAVVYSFMYTESNEDGNVVMHIKKPQSKVCEEETQLIASLQNMLAKPNIFFKISGTKALSEDMTVIVLTADDRTSLRRVLATDLSTVLLHPQFKQQLDNLGIVSICPKVRPSPEQLKAYLDNAPAGLDPRVWKKAQEDNPDPENMIPIPLLGPDALKHRLQAQQKENQQHFERLRLIGDEVGNLHNRHANMSAELQQLRHRYTILTHRIISAIVRLQIVQKQGFPIQPEEEELKKQIQGLEKQLNSPTHFRGRLNELMSHVRLHKTTLEQRGLVKYSVEPSTLEQIKEFLNLQQGSISHLVETVKSCMEHAQRMNEDVAELNEKRVSS